jgi:hypothetical protein
LTVRAEITAALADAKLPDLGAATETGPAGPTVDGQLSAEIARPALFIGKIPQGRPAGLDGGLQYLANGFRQAPVTLNLPSRPAGVFGRTPARNRASLA